MFARYYVYAAYCFFSGIVDEFESLMIRGTCVGARKLLVLSQLQPNRVRESASNFSPNNLFRINFNFLEVCQYKSEMDSLQQLVIKYCYYSLTNSFCIIFFFIPQVPELNMPHVHIRDVQLVEGKIQSLLDGRHDKLQVSTQPNRIFKKHLLTKLLLLPTI